MLFSLGHYEGLFMHMSVFHCTLYYMLIDSSIVNCLFVPEVLDSKSDLYAK